MNGPLSNMIFLLLAGASCAHAELTAVDPVTNEVECGTSDITAEDDPILPSTRWAHTSAEYQAIVRQTYTYATQLIRDMIDSRKPGTWAVVLDADETVISNAAFDWELQMRGAEETEENWLAWTKRHEATAMPGVIRFLEQIHRWGGRIAIVTNRFLNECPDTELNFKKHGIPYDVIFCQGSDSEKESRWDAIERGTASPGVPPLEILLWVGDNIRDFPEMDQDLRFKGDESFSLFGTRYLVMPNPMHGSWTDNLPK
jgi:5'-nucleotidase (lipoprotein e(P4) family)